MVESWSGVNICLEAVEPALPEGGGYASLSTNLNNASLPSHHSLYTTNPPPSSGFPGRCVEDEEEEFEERAEGAR